MTQIEFASALIRLTRFQIGIGEASVLFSIGEGTNKFDIAKKTGLEPEGARSVIGKLRTKGACRTVYDEDGNARYVLTDDGKRIISETIRCLASCILAF